ncbi:MAG: FtsW/RodA/SpoVE family cell cycle protein, partial [Butyrivibrio sp.]|nr:FtsW/RodA/SpoVE family cell cycle protein [Butyrivibrio sp.]
TKFIPLTGVTLPLVSYGGSSVLSTVLMFSIFEGIFRAEAEESDTEEEAAEA